MLGRVEQINLRYLAVLGILLTVGPEEMVELANDLDLNNLLPTSPPTGPTPENIFVCLFQFDVLRSLKTGKKKRLVNNYRPTCPALDRTPRSNSFQ